MGHTISTLALAAGALALSGVPVLGAPSAAQQCAAFKIKATGKYYQCRMQADAKAVKKGTTPDFAKCDTKVVEAFQKAEVKYGTACPTADDSATIQSQIQEHASAIVDDLQAVPDLTGASIISLRGIQVTASSDPTLTIRNTSNSLITASCFFASEIGCTVADFTVELIKKEVVSWPAGIGDVSHGIPPVATIPFAGEMVCVEIDAASAPIGGNHLSGSVAEPGQCTLPALGILGNENNNMDNLLILGSIDEYDSCPASIGEAHIESCWSQSASFTFECN